MDMAFLSRLGGGGGAGGGGDGTMFDTSEQVHISSLALLKMLKHGRAGVPMEVMGLLIGEFIDDYTVRVVDVFSMPQSGTGVSVEAVDPVFQTKMLDMLKQTWRFGPPTQHTHTHTLFRISCGRDMQRELSSFSLKYVSLMIEGSFVITSFISYFCFPAELKLLSDGIILTLDLVVGCQVSTSAPNKVLSS
eukprot:TRINITY_DN5695_c0_g1_i1.p1 TRINITY_DN5695_c0_g1~~TRINITY_DN5695_c0_g1_i1.p1  ORF type:complete len:191 (+),score=50.55 TRINITY_DN5695_c0_g1_i1:222-794(+)